MYLGTKILVSYRVGVFIMYYEYVTSLFNCNGSAKTCVEVNIIFILKLNTLTSKYFSQTIVKFKRESKTNKNNVIGLRTKNWEKDRGS